MKTYQKEFLLNHFFKNESYAGWKNIAEKLLDKGKCIVAGNKCIWNSGIGNFIKTEPAMEAVDCLLYTFDLQYFLSSEWFKEIHKYYLSELEQEKIRMEQEYEEISSL